MESLTHSLLALTLLAAPACGDDASSSSSDEGGSADSGGQQPAAVDCPERCAAKASDCGAPPDIAAAQCQGVCGASLSEDQLECLEDENCGALEQAFLGSGDVCGIGGSSASGGSASGGSSGGTNPTTGTIGDACECSNPDADYESCSGTGSSCGDLTCYVVFGDGICSQPCTADADGDDCPSGECTEQIVNGVTVGTWCVP